MRFYCCLILIFFLPVLLLGQQQNNTYSREISISSENDAYLFAKKDAYYTNGLFFSLRKSVTRQNRKILYDYSLGQMIFTPLIRKTESPSDIDRPYCGYLGFTVSKTSFNATKSLLGFSVTVAELGRSSLGESLQTAYHQWFHYARFTGWGYQVTDAIGVDLGIKYGTTLWEDSCGLKLSPRLEASLGMNFTRASAGTYFCAGHFEKNSNSILWNAGSGKKEFFIFWYPQLILQGYNATIQGGMWQKGTGAVLGTPNTWLFQQSLGICFAAGRWSAKVAYVYQDREAVAQTNQQEYGSVQLSYRLQ